MLKLEPIAYIHTDFKEKFGIPRQSGRAGALEGTVKFLPEYRNPDALRGIEKFSHLWLIFDFSKAHKKGWSATVRPPRLGGNKRVGVFASRSPFRPNPIGLSSVRLKRVEKTEKDGTVLVVSGIDLLDMTPIYDIKPYIPYADCHEDAKGSYAEENSAHRLKLEFPKELLGIIPKEKRRAVCECLADDPRPSYQSNADRVYSMKFAEFDIHFRVENLVLKVLKIDKLG